MPVMYDNYETEVGNPDSDYYQDDAWGRPWGHPDWGKDPTDPSQTSAYPNAPAPSAPNPEPPQVEPSPDEDTGGDTGGGGSPAPSILGDWFTRNPPPADFGAVPAPFGETYTALARPAHLADPYVAPQWTESFVEPDLPVELQTPWTPPDWQKFLQDPGVLAALAASQKGFERSAAAKGSILSGGTQVALGRALQNETASQYGAATDRSLTQRNQLLGEHQTKRGNAYANYQQRYGAFVDNANRGFQARQTNEQAYQTDVGNNLNQYNTRYNAYLDAISHKRNAETDWWNRGMDLSRLGLDATTAGGA